MNSNLIPFNEFPSSPKKEEALQLSVTETQDWPSEQKLIKKTPQVKSFNSSQAVNAKKQDDGAGVVRKSQLKVALKEASDDQKSSLIKLKKAEAEEE